MATATNMPNFQFPISKVPLPRSAQPLQVPQGFDPADVIMQAAALQQQRELAQRQEQQKYMQGFLESVQAATQLAESKRQANQKNAIAEATLKIAESKVEPEKLLLEAQSNWANAQAKSFEGASETASALYNEAQAGRLTGEQAAAIFSRNPGLRNAWAVEIARRSQSGQPINFRALAAEQAGQTAEAKLPFNVSIQQRMRNYTAALPQLATLADMVGDLPQGNFQDLNTIANALATKSGSRAANAFKTQVSRVLLTLRAASPNGTDAVLDQDIQQLNLTKSKEQLRDSIRLLFKDAVNQRNVLDPTNPGHGFMTDEEKRYGLYPNAPGFGGLGRLRQEDTSPGGSLMGYFNSLINGAVSNKSETAPSIPRDIVEAARVERLRRKGTK